MLARLRSFTRSVRRTLDVRTRHGRRDAVPSREPDGGSRRARARARRRRAAGPPRIRIDRKAEGRGARRRRPPPVRRGRAAICASRSACSPPTRAFTATAIVTLALGIGANAAIFNLMDALMLRSLPVDRPQQLLQLSLAVAGRQERASAASRIRSCSPSISSATSSPGSRATRPPTSRSAPARSMARVPGALVTGSFYETLGLQPAAGRLLSRADDAPGAPVVAVASYGYWERAFARDPGIVGRTIVLNGVPADIVGVSPRGFTGANVGAHRRPHASRRRASHCRRRRTRACSGRAILAARAGEAATGRGAG